MVYVSVSELNKRINTYNRFREYELEATLFETRKDLAEGHFLEKSIEDHIHRITNEV
ncbi:MAG TPA: hypothetical protein VK469_05850 [Candidatus Kapabacteria bacterium]|nr:hypothetical protein [Candidatus Kapabacteria bacterium]